MADVNRCTVVYCISLYHLMLYSSGYFVAHVIDPGDESEKLISAGV